MVRRSLLAAALAGVVLLCCLASSSAAIPSFPLYNTAVSGLRIPAIGIGTGGYAFNPSVGWGGYPECFDDASGCDEYTIRTLMAWFQAGGTRLDLANTYGNTRSVGRALQAARIPRADLFILTKVGPGQFDVPLGFNDTLIQFAQIQRDYGVQQVDLLLIHWPTQVIPQSSDPACRLGAMSYDAKECRLSTWRAMLRIFDAGHARAVGVSNFNQTHLQEIIDAGLRLPAYNQCPFHLYRSQTQESLIRFCRQHNITFGGYSPLGVPDWQIFPEGDGMAYTPMEDADVKQIAAAHGRTPAQVLLNWQFQLGIPTNPRSQNAEHMRENLAAFDFNLTDSDMKALGGKPQDLCRKDPAWYECANNTSSSQSARGGYGSMLLRKLGSLFD